MNKALKRCIKPIHKIIEDNNKEVITFILSKIYFSEFKIIDGLNQHPTGLNFEKWLLKNMEVF